MTNSDESPGLQPPSRFNPGSLATTTSGSAPDHHQTAGWNAPRGPNLLVTRLHARLRVSTWCLVANSSPLLPWDPKYWDIPALQRGRKDELLYQPRVAEARCQGT